ncbi:S-adenosyl-L-methionine-dependent methyltransferase [Mycena latifolia]|nr:S-adenosyl-L-methionine-dependent methyltransferase [Mycena latifolia]
MLQDSVRIRSYHNAIAGNRDLFKDKLVLDVGCGTGILSMFAVKAGASHVFAIDTSDIIDHAQKIIDANGFTDKITLVKGKVEDADLPPRRFDIIVSEWMGYCLVYESILDTVLLARDKFLKPDGLMFPDTASLTIAAIEAADYRDEKINFWDNVYGLDYSCIKDIALREPVVDVVDLKSVVTDICTIKEIDLLTAQREQLPFTAQFSLKATRDDFVHAFVLWFNVSFRCCKKPMNISTAPYSKYTHWKQTIFYTPSALVLSEDQKLTGSFSCVPNEENNHDLDIAISHEIDGASPGRAEYKWY